MPVLSHRTYFDKLNMTSRVVSLSLSKTLGITKNDH